MSHKTGHDLTQKCFSMLTNGLRFPKAEEVGASLLQSSSVGCSSRAFLSRRHAILRVASVGAQMLAQPDDGDFELLPSLPPVG
jgi:hypothetical protein